MDYKDAPLTAVVAWHVFERLFAFGNDRKCAVCMDSPARDSSQFCARHLSPCVSQAGVFHGAAIVRARHACCYSAVNNTWLGVFGLAAFVKASVRLAGVVTE